MSREISKIHFSSSHPEETGIEAKGARKKLKRRNEPIMMFGINNLT